MKTESGQNPSVWTATADVESGKPLAEEVRADVCVVGAGIAGMTTAYLLTREGREVVVLDDGKIASGETSRTTAHITNALDDRYYHLERLHGEPGARLAAESHTAAIDKVEEIITEEGIDCDFTRLDGYLFVPPGDSTEQLGEELRAAHRAGMTEVEYVERVPYPHYDFGAALRFPRQGQFHILKYIEGLRRAFARMGGRVYTETHAEKIEGGDAARVETSSRYAVSCESIVVATNTPVNDLVAIHTKQAPYRTYVIGARVPSGSVPQMLLWDTPDPYHYIRTQRVGGEAGAGAYDVLIVGGEDHKTGQAEDYEARYGRLEEWAGERFPMIESVEFRWSGQVMEPVDGLAYIGRNPMDKDNVFIATGDSGNGMTHGTIAGILLTDLITGRANKWESLYEPTRVAGARAPLEYAKENLNVAAQYADHVTGGEVESVEEVAPGTGAVVRRGLSKVAAYRDQSGDLYEHSAVCTHLGCVVRWNSTERTWDCPCHGSRFDKRDGHVLNGPASSGLSPAE
ncbi:MAG TPA: FAD-dependent oxidoreductase [Pyrinomonadaceae bacterium]|nr:FAD-dependent oxidoreductase [Pyrinomonadaceae bacterium]